MVRQPPVMAACEAKVAASSNSIMMWLELVSPLRQSQRPSEDQLAITNRFEAATRSDHLRISALLSVPAGIRCRTKICGTMPSRTWMYQPARRSSPTDWENMAQTASPKIGTTSRLDLMVSTTPRSKAS